ncbi:hypothetical protein F5Y16DRAFT_395993 [Xylariaceae sp. FL0255]|nr:hypothetical protein F5Y16DRAFT_395993 [Xylariaceae sp. FL0255]
MVLRKKEVYTIITPIPGFIPRQLAIDILHSHGEVINVNPLVLSHKQIQAPRDAAADEYYSTWYEITERLQLIPGVGKLGSSKIAFNACFHDLPTGLQTHVYAPLNIDLRTKYTIGGNQPGVEPPVTLEIGMADLGAPKDGLYLREDIEIKCNITMVATVKAQTKSANKAMINRIIKKAELLDSGVLKAMIEDGKLKTFKPLDRTYTGGLAEQTRSPQLSPANPYGPGPGTPASPTIPYQVPRPISSQPGGIGDCKRPGTSSSLGYPAHWQQGQQQQQYHDHHHNANLQPQYAELPSNPLPGTQSFPMELPGDFHFTQQPQSSPRFQQPQPSPNSLHSSASDAARWSQGPQPHSPTAPSTRPTSYSSDHSHHQQQQQRTSPHLEQKGGFASELPTHRETHEEHYRRTMGGGCGGGGPQQLQPPQDMNKYRHNSYTGSGYAYNPADYSNTRH